MDGYPLNLILAVATASATIFLGFLPTKSISSTFFAKQTALAIVMWAIVAFTSPSQIIHYLLAMAFLCFASWWNFRRDRALSGKMWLSIASGLGISVSVMLIIKVIPRAIPPGLPQLNETLLLTSIYLGGAGIGLAYVCYALAQGPSSGVTQGLIQRYVGLLPYLALARAAAILATFFLLSGHFESKTAWYKNNTPPASIVDHGSRATMYVLKESDTDTRIPLTTITPMVLAVLLLPFLAFLAQKQASLSSRTQPTRTLIAIMGLGLLTEIGARLLGL